MELLLYKRDPADFLFLKALVQCTVPVCLALIRKHLMLLEVFSLMDLIHKYLLNLNFPRWVIALGIVNIITRD